MYFRATAIVLNNMAVELLGHKMWQPAVETFQEAAQLMQYVVSPPVDTVAPPTALPLDCRAIIATAERRVLRSISRPQTQQRQRQQLIPAEHSFGGDDNEEESHSEQGFSDDDDDGMIYPVLLHFSTTETAAPDLSTIQAESSMILYNYALALERIGASATSIYRLLQLSSQLMAALPQPQHTTFRLHLTERLWSTAHQLGWEDCCQEHGRTMEQLLLWQQQQQQPPLCGLEPAAAPAA